MFYNQKTNILEIGNDSMFQHPADGEEHVYDQMSREEVLAWKERYVEKHKEPYHEVVSYLKKLGETAIHKNIFTKEGFYEMYEKPDLLNQYINDSADMLFKADESWKRVYKNTLINSIESANKDQKGLKFSDMQDLFSVEGVGAMATYQNRDNFSGLMAFGIGGWFGRSKILNLYLPIEENSRPEFSIKYTLEFALHPKTRERIPLPAGYRDESLLGTFDLLDVLVLYVDESSTPHIMNDSTTIEVIDVEKSTSDSIKYKEVELGHGFIKAGKPSNLLIDSSSDDNDIDADDSLEPTASIAEILYVYSYKDPGGAKTPIYRKLRFQLRPQSAEGLQNVFRYRGVIKFPEIYVVEAGELKKITNHQEKILGEIHIDKGDFIATSISYTPGVDSVIKAFKPEAKISDVANKRAGLEHEIEKYYFTFKIEYSNFGHIPLTPYMLDNWNLGNDTLGYVATMTDAMTRAYAITRDLKLERHLRNDFEAERSSFPLTDKLGGFYKEIEHNFALTGPVLDANPYVQTRYALQERVIAALATAETELYFEQDVSRQWIFFGPDRKVRAFANVQMFNRNPDDNETRSVNAAGSRFGFNLDESASIIDSLGRNVKIIGITDIRWLDKNIIGGLKSNDINYPTFLYYAHLFRIFTGIDPRYRNLSAVLFMGRDAVYSMVQAHSQIIITNMGDDLYEQVVNEARTRMVITRG